MNRKKAAELAGKRPELRTKLVPLLKRGAKAGSLAANAEWLKKQDERLAKEYHAAATKRVVEVVGEAVPEFGQIRGKWDSPREVFRGDVAGIGCSIYLPLWAFRTLEKGNLKIAVSAGRGYFMDFRTEDIDFLDPNGLADFLVGKLAMFVRRSLGSTK